jgi:SAM-dependent methyltransferase
MKESPCERPSFDAYAAGYDAALAQGLSVSGENKDFFAEGRAVWLAKRRAELGIRVQTAIDFGCGTGSATPFLLRWLELASLVGLDPSPASIAVARQNHGSDRASFFTLQEFKAAAPTDLVFCNGVFHHIPVAERAGAVRFIHQILRPEGLFAFWENNPWNPGTRYIMSRIPFDRDAITLSPTEATRMLEVSGFQVIRKDFRFYFPRALSWLRCFERPLVHLPLGAQYLILCRKP